MHDASNSPGGRLHHPATSEDEVGTALAQAHLTDQQRLAMVLQGAALLVHLESAGLYLGAGWERAAISSTGQLLVAGVRQGSAAEMPQVHLVRLLLSLFDSEEDIAGRGEARRAGRRLLRRWRQTLRAVPPSDAVADIFEAAPFLWMDSFAVARQCFVAEIEIEAPTSRGKTSQRKKSQGKQSRGKTTRLSLAAPARVRRRLLRQASDASKLQVLLASSAARHAWEGEVDHGAMTLAEQGNWEQAALAWGRQPPTTADTGLAYGRCLFALGRYSRVLEVLRRHQRFDAVLLRLRSQVYLGEIDAGHKTLSKLSKRKLTAEQTLRLGDVAIRLLASRRADDEIRDWVARCQSVAKGSMKPRAALIAAAAAWDREDWAAMEGYLEDAKGARSDAALAGRWHHWQGLWCRAVGDGLGAIEHMQRAMGFLRRSLPPVEAGRLWNDLAIVRAAAGELAGAERACRHAVRLMHSSEGPSRLTLGLYNLAEVRIRRGRLQGVETILEGSTAANRRSKNARGLVHDLELWVRFELAQGRANAALARCSEALQGSDPAALGDRHQVFDLFAARALGWLGRPLEAARCLERVGPYAVQELEAEERPAVFALAGLADEAARQAAEGPWAELWNPLLLGDHPPPSVWAELNRLEGYRAARLIFDCERVLTASVPPHRVRWAVTTLRDCGAPAFADRLENRSLSPWRVLEKYLATSSKGSETFAPEALATLLSDAGFGDCRLTYHGALGERLLIDGEGGDVCLESPWEDGTLSLRSATSDRALETLFRLVQRDLSLSREILLHETQPKETLRTSSKIAPVRSRPRGGIIGESAALRAALERVDRLAPGKLPILLLGESGTGKELFARRVHVHSPRAEAPFIPLNCAALAESLIQSDLFGHVRGAFTGADRDRAGIFETARGGTVFLDEIGDLPPSAQGKLLRVLQESEVRRVGESFARKVDARIVAATHRDLETMVQAGEFRQDLFFRLKVVTVRLPALRERGQDTLILADYFIDRQLRDQPRLALSEAARTALLAHDWPGNVRQLENVLEVAAALAAGEEILPEHLELPEAREGRKGDYHQRIETYRRQLISEALEKSGGNRAKASRQLGLSRQALSYLVKQFGLS